MWRNGRYSSVKGGVALALKIMVIPILAMGGLGVWAVDSSTTEFEAAADDQAEDSLVAIELHDDLMTAEYWALLYASTAQPGAKTHYLELLPQIEDNLDEILTLDTSEEQQIARQIADAWAVAGPVGVAAIDNPPGSSATDEVDPLEEFYPAVHEAIEGLADLRRLSLNETADTISTIKADRDQFLLGLVGILAITLLGAGLMSRRLRRLIHTPLARLGDAARRFGDRDFDHRVDMPRNDEFAEVGRAFNAMAVRVSTGQAASERLQHQLRHQALHDPLTGLANRTLLADRLAHSLQRLARTPGKVGVLLLDVDDFKSINDTFGHNDGDEILVSIGKRLQLCVRTDDTVARLSGDEFVVLLGDMAADEDHEVILARIHEAMSFVFVDDDDELSVHMSIGIALTGDSKLAGQELLRRADVAMFAAKARGKNNSLLFDPTMDGNVIGRAQLKTQLMHAVGRGEMKALFQPLLSLASGLVVGAEALIRWDHPTEGRLGPGQFLPAAEEHGLMCELDRWMLKEACRRSVAWRRFGTEHFSISVNLSGMSLQSDEIIDDVARTLTETGIPPEDLILEITESAFVNNNAIWRLSELKKLGVRLAVDDFGTGYSSLSYLMHFPIDILKIDKSFVDEVGRGRGSDLTKAIVGIAKALRLETVAEGIERSDQLGQLSSYGVDLGQGFLFAKPLEEEEFRTLLHWNLAGHKVILVKHPPRDRQPA